MEKVHPRSAEAYQLLHKGILAFARAERQGLRVDVAYIEKKMVHLTRRIDRMEKVFKETKFFRRWQHSKPGKVNIHSNEQLGAFLYGVLKLKVEKETESGKGSTDEETLLQFNIPELNQLIEIRKLKKVRDTYLGAFYREQVDGYIHPFFNLHLVRTYRSSSDSPNFQNIPKRDEESMQIVRRAIYPRPGHLLVEIDYSGLEVHISACYHRDQRMIQYINNPASDMHSDMAKQIFMLDKFDPSIEGHKVLRQAAKNGFVFPEFYGDYFKSCAANIACKWGELPKGKWAPKQGIKLNGEYLSDHLIAKGIKSLEGFEKHLKKIEDDFWGKRFADYDRWKSIWYNVYKKYGYIDLKTGFRCSGLMDKKNTSNYPIQGAAFHCLLWSFIEIDRIMIKENWDTKIVGQIHDSIVLDVNPAELKHVIKTVRKVTCVDLPKAWKWIIVPLEVDVEVCPIDGSWAEKQKYSMESN